MGNAVADLKPVQDLTWFGLGCSLTESQLRIKSKRYVNQVEAHGVLAVLALVMFEEPFLVKSARCFMILAYWFPRENLRLVPYHEGNFLNLE